MILFYDPPAMNSLALPIAEAMYIVHGGKLTPDLENPQNHEILNSLCQCSPKYVRLQTGGFGTPIQYVWGSDAIDMVKSGTPVHIVVNINDVHLFINEKTTLQGALERFHHKLNWLHTHKSPVHKRDEGRQRE